MDLCAEALLPACSLPTGRVHGRSAAFFGRKPFLQTGLSLYRVVDRLVEEAQQPAETIVVDLHAEATGEKVAMGTSWTGA